MIAAELMMIFRRHIKTEFQELDMWQVMEDLQLCVLYNILRCMGIPIWKPKFTFLSKKHTVQFYDPLKPKQMQLLGFLINVLENVFLLEKEGLITELRKELRLSNEEHRELLLKVNSDDVIRRTREWRQSSGLQPGMVNTGQAVHDPLPSPSVSENRKKQKMNPSGHS